MSDLYDVDDYGIDSSLEDDFDFFDGLNEEEPFEGIPTDEVLPSGVPSVEEGGSLEDLEDEGGSDSDEVIISDSSSDATETPYSSQNSEEVSLPPEELSDLDKPSGGVERYVTSDVTYPCLVLNGSLHFPEHVVSALSRMIDSSLVVQDVIKVYLHTDTNELLSIGGISNLQVNAVIDLLGRESLTAYYSKGYELKGDLIYVLST